MLTKSIDLEKPAIAELTDTQKAIIQKNIVALAEQQRRENAARPRSQRLAQWITDFSGSMLFVYLHACWFSLWILLNLGWLKIVPLRQFDPFPFGLLTLIVSLEAIFLSTFVLIAQNRLARQSERRTELDLHINLLAEQKTAKILDMLDQIGSQLDHTMQHFHFTADAETRAFKTSPEPAAVLTIIEEAINDETNTFATQLEETTDKLAAHADEMQRVQTQVEQMSDQMDSLQDRLENKAEEHQLAKNTLE